MFHKSADLYDAIYAEKDYGEECRLLKGILQREIASPGRQVLDVACGTGKHIECLRSDFHMEGLELDANMLALARRRLPEVIFHQASMLDFDLGRQYDAVVCLFSSIGYLRTVSRLEEALSTMARHVLSGGLVVIEPWFTPSTYVPGGSHARFVDQQDTKVCRMVVSRQRGRLAVLNFHYLVARHGRIEHFTEKHELGLFTHEEYLRAFERAGLRASHDPHGLTGRGLYLGRMP